MEHPYLDIVCLKDPFTGELNQIPVAMIGAYLPYASDLFLEKAAEVAKIRDEEEAANLELSCKHTEYLFSDCPSGSLDDGDGTGYDRLSVPIV